VEALLRRKPHEIETETEDGARSLLKNKNALGFVQKKKEIKREAKVGVWQAGELCAALDLPRCVCVCVLCVVCVCVCVCVWE
jgi:hypothetical protein